MGFSGWDESYSVGHPLMDSHHRQLFDMIADLRTVMSSGDELLEYNAEWEVAERLVSYAGAHLAAEEALMEAVGYPDMEKHKELHCFFLSKVCELERGIQNGEAALSLEQLCVFLEKWQASHILLVDSQYVPYVRGAASQVLNLTYAEVACSGE